MQLIKHFWQMALVHENKLTIMKWQNPSEALELFML